jgi:hypothetical protein
MKDTQKSYSQDWKYYEIRKNLHEKRKMSDIGRFGEEMKKKK